MDDQVAQRRDLAIGVILSVLAYVLAANAGLSAVGCVRRRVGPAAGCLAQPLWGLLLAFLLAAINPKNLLLAAAAGVAIGSAGVTVGQATLAIAIFTVVAGATVLVPVIGYLVAADAMRGPLDALRHWLIAHNAAVMTVLLFVIGVVMIGKGIGSF